MGALSDYLENQLADLTLGSGTFTPPATVYVALYTVAPTDAGGGTEVTGGSYARVAVTNNSTNFPNAVAGVKKNGTAITFPEATVAWGTIVAYAILDASSGGNFLFYGALNASKVIDVADQFYFPVNELTLTWD